MAQGQTYGRFSGRGSSPYDVMAMAKKMGAKKGAQDKYDEFQTKFDDYTKKMGWAKNVGSIADLISMFALPSAAPLKGLKAGQAAWNVAGRAAKAGAGFSIGSLVQDLAERHFLKDDYKNMPEYDISDLGVYASQFTDPLKRDAKTQLTDLKSSIANIWQDRAKLHGMRAFGTSKGVEEKGFNFMDLLSFLK